MIRFFKTLQPATLAFIPFIIIVFWVKPLLDAYPVTDSNSMPIWNAFAAMFFRFPEWMNIIFFICLISGEAIYFNLLLNKYEVHYKNTYVPALVFALFISCTPAMIQIHPIHLVNLLVLFILDKMFSLYKNELPVSSLFDSGFLSGIAALIYFPAIILLPLLLVSLAILRPFSLKEWLITIIAFFLPFFFLFTYMFWNHQLKEFRNSFQDHLNNIHSFFAIENNLKIITLSVIIGVLLILSLLKMRMHYRKNVIRTRSFQQIIFILLLFGFLWIYLSGKIQVIHFSFLMIPVSVFCSYFFLSAKKKIWMYEGLLWGLIGVIVWNQLG